MGRYFKIIDKHRTDGRSEYIDNCLRRPDGIYEAKDFVVECLSEEEYKEYTI